jgi:hypothetical protein
VLFCRAALPLSRRTLNRCAADARGGVRWRWIPNHRDGWMWDLTIPGNDDHYFFVDTIAAAVLVHNCSLMIGDGGTHVTSRTLMQNEDFPSMSRTQPCTHIRHLATIRI